MNRVSVIFELERVRVAGSGLYAFLNGLLLPLPFRLRSPQACSGMTQSRNFNKIYLNSIKHGHNIKLNVLKLWFTSGFEFLHHVAFYNSFLTRREK